MRTVRVAIRYDPPDVAASAEHADHHWLGRRSAAEFSDRVPSGRRRPSVLRDGIVVATRDVDLADGAALSVEFAVER